MPPYPPLHILAHLSTSARSSDVVGPGPHLPLPRSTPKRLTKVVWLGHSLEEGSALEERRRVWGGAARAMAFGGDPFVGWELQWFQEV